MTRQSIWRTQITITMTTENLCVISYNLHGLNQGAPGIKELMKTLKPDVIMMQEHWLTSDNLSKLNALSDDYNIYYRERFTAMKISN